MIIYVHISCHPGKPVLRMWDRKMNETHVIFVIKVLPFGQDPMESIIALPSFEFLSPFYFQMIFSHWVEFTKCCKGLESSLETLKDSATKSKQWRSSLQSSAEDTSP